MDSLKSKHYKESDDDTGSDAGREGPYISSDTEDSMDESMSGRRMATQKPHEVSGYPSCLENEEDTALDVYECVKDMLDRGDERFEYLLQGLRKIQVNARMPQTTRVIKTAIKEVMVIVDNIRRIGCARAARVNQLKAVIKKEAEAKEMAIAEAKKAAARPLVQVLSSSSTEPGGSVPPSVPVPSTSKEDSPMRIEEEKEKEVFKKPLAPPPTPRLARRSTPAAGPPSVSPILSPLPSPLPSPLAKRKAAAAEESESPKVKRKPSIISIETLRAPKTDASTQTEIEAPAQEPKADKQTQPISETAPPQKSPAASKEEKKDDAPAVTWATVTRRNKKKTPRAPAGASPAKEPQKRDDESGADSRKTMKKKRSTTPWKPRDRPAAVEIKIGEGASYAATLVRIKKEVKMDDVTVTSIRRTRAGNILLETGKSQEDARSARTAIASVLGETAEVRQLEQRSDIEIRDIDEVTTKEEIVEALTREVPNIDGVMLFRALKTGFGGLRAAIITLPSTMANDLVKRGRIKIGWVSCRVKALPRLTRCFKCHRLGHLAANCLMPPGPATCRGCHAAGHVLKECKVPPTCLACKEGGLQGNHEHITASRKCPIYQRIARSQGKP